MKIILYIHGKGGNAGEAAAFQKNCPGYIVRGVDYHGENPWEVAKELQEAYQRVRADADSVLLLANSIGAYYGMLALQGCPLEKALLISPVVDMEQLILDMMGWAGVTEKELETKGEIPTSFGETLSWEYLSFVRAHPIHWDIPTEILYGGRDDSPGVGGKVCQKPLRPDYRYGRGGTLVSYRGAAGFFGPVDGAGHPVPGRFFAGKIRTEKPPEELLTLPEAFPHPLAATRLLIISSSFRRIRSSS